MSKRDLTYEAACAKLQEALQSLSEVIGPRHCSLCDDDDECEHPWDETQPRTDLMLNNFVLIANWTELEDGESFVSYLTAPMQLNTQAKGLLWVALTEY